MSKDWTGRCPPQEEVQIREIWHLAQDVRVDGIATEFKSKQANVGGLDWGEFGICQTYELLPSDEPLL
jgi:hypothetical protein